MSVEKIEMTELSSTGNHKPVWDASPKLKVWEIILVATSALVVLVASTSVFLR